jgi:hypothetical protein
MIETKPLRREAIIPTMSLPRAGIMKPARTAKSMKSWRVSGWTRMMMSFPGPGEPESGELVGFDRVAVEEVQDILVVGSIEAKRPDETGHAEQIVADGECDEDENEPEEGFGSGECGIARNLLFEWRP